MNNKVKEVQNNIFVSYQYNNYIVNDGVAPVIVSTGEPYLHLKESHKLKAPTNQNNYIKPRTSLH